MNIQYLIRKLTVIADEIERKGGPGAVNLEVGVRFQEEGETEVDVRPIRRVGYEESDDDYLVYVSTTPLPRNDSKQDIEAERDEGRQRRAMLLRGEVIFGSTTMNDEPGAT